MNETTEELKAIVEGAPEDATHVDDEGDYFLRPVATQRYWRMWSIEDNKWFDSSASPTISLDNLRTIISQHDRIVELERERDELDAVFEAVLNACGYELTIKRKQL